MPNPIFTGSGVALITPLHKDGAVNYTKLRELTQWHISQHTDALIVCGTTGEASTLSTKEKLNIIQTVIEQAAGHIPVIAGTGTNDTASAVFLSQKAQELGADGLLLITPYYNKTTQSGLIKHFFAVADRVDIPCILYNVPSRTTVNIHIQTYENLAKHPNIVATKEASGNLAVVERIVNRCGDELLVYSGCDELYLPMLSIGAVGVISVLANILPTPMHEMYQHFSLGHYKECRNLQNEWIELIDALFSQVNPIPIKTAMNLLGMNVGPCRLPLCDMDEEPKQALLRVMEKYELK